jgi:hypothetical protein
MSMIKYPIAVPPERLWWQCGDIGPKRLAESKHAINACKLVAGEDDLVETGTEGSRDRLSPTLESMTKGWDQRQQPIIAGINRRGEIVIHDGWHRAACAYALKWDFLPVAIHWRDEDWWALKHAVAKLNGGSKLYQPIDHPDFYYWPAWRKDTFYRADLIDRFLKENISEPRIADIGCHSGVLSCALSRKGYAVTGYDNNPKAIRAANLMSCMTDIGAKGAIFVESDKVINGFNVAVCISVINHYFVRGDDEKTRDFLSQFEGKTLILDCPTSGDPVGGDTDFTDPEFVFDWLEKHGLDGKGRVLEYHGQNLQRTMMVWE